FIAVFTNAAEAGIAGVETRLHAVDRAVVARSGFRNAVSEINIDATGFCGGTSKHFDRLADNEEIGRATGGGVFETRESLIVVRGDALLFDVGQDDRGPGLFR